MTDKFYLTETIVEDHKSEEYEEMIYSYKQERMIDPDATPPELPTVWGNYALNLSYVLDWYEYPSTEGTFVKLKNGEITRIRETFNSFTEIMNEHVTICNYSK